MSSAGDSSGSGRNYGGLSFRPAASQAEALQALRSFVKSLGVEDLADTEDGLLLQAAPYMSESLDENLKTAWTPEERRRLDAQPMPEHLDHTNRDHEYFFFKQMRRSLDRRASRSTSFGSYRSEELSRRPSPTPDALGHMTPEEEAYWRADCRRKNMAAVWGADGRAVLTALDALPEQDVLKDVTPPGSATTSQSSQLQHNQFKDHSDLHQQPEPEAQAQQQQLSEEASAKQKEKQKEKRFFCF